ncbi:unnamed protein product, partial [Vitis vinifera]|uniref:Uncharacterized protein n=1 Tax=Vitis vinifera TaxID=29760 RepID=D7T449_VITVI
MIVDNLFENSINLLSNFFTSCIVSLNAKFLFFCYFFHEMDCKKHNILHKLSFPFIYENFIALILEGKKDNPFGKRKDSGHPVAVAGANGAPAPPTYQ